MTSIAQPARRGPLIAVWIGIAAALMGLAGSGAYAAWRVTDRERVDRQVESVQYQRVVVGDDFQEAHAKILASGGRTYLSGMYYYGPDRVSSYYELRDKTGLVLNISRQTTPRIIHEITLGEPGRGIHKFDWFHQTKRKPLFLDLFEQ